MLLKPYDPGCLAHTSCLMAAIVAPQRDLDPCPQDAFQLALDIRYILLTIFVLIFSLALWSCVNAWATPGGLERWDVQAGEVPWLAGKVDHGQGNVFQS